MRFVRKQNRDEWKISPRNFTVRPTSFQNHPRVYLFPEFSLFPYFFEPSHARSIFPSTNWNSFPKDRNDGRNMDLDFYSRYEGIRSRTAARFNWISSVARLEFDFYFAREWFGADGRGVRVSLISRSPLPVESPQSISHPRDRDRISRIIEKRRGRVSFARKLNSRSRRFISSGAAACRQLQLPNFIFRVFGHRETRDRLVKLDWRTEFDRVYAF